MQVDQRTIRDPKNFQVTFIEQCYCLPSRFQRRITGWQPIFNAEWTSIAEARKSLATRPKSTSRWNGVRLVKRVHYQGDVREEVVI